jgi:hypothetical protein
VPGPTPQELIADLARAFPRQPVTAETLRIYLRELADIPPAALETACRELMRASEFFPTIRAIREAAAEHLLALPGEAGALAQIEARMAWGRADEDERGEAPGVHPLVREAVDHVGGFHAFRATDEPAVVRGQFLRLFRDLRGRAVRDAQIGQLELPGRAPVRELDRG